MNDAERETMIADVGAKVDRILGHRRPEPPAEVVARRMVTGCREAGLADPYTPALRAVDTVELEARYRDIATPDRLRYWAAVRREIGRLRGDDHDRDY